jgi:DNA-binding transcriptional MerR regulator
VLAAAGRLSAEQHLARIARPPLGNLCTVTEAVQSVADRAPGGGLTIGQVSELLGVPVPTLRSWHERYGIAAPHRTSGGHRRYGPEQVEALRALATAVARGIAPRSAAQALREPQRDPELPAALVRLLDRAVARDQPGITAVLDEQERTVGVESAVDRLLLPALQEVGRRWELGLVDAGVEHLATAAARSWIARRTGTTPQRGVAPVLLAAAPGNRHTVALEAFHMLLDRRGWPTCQLGADTPVDALVSAYRSSAPQAVVVTAHQVSRRRHAVEALQALHRQPGAALFYAGAAFSSPSRRRDAPGTYLGDVLPAAVDLLERSLTRRGSRADLR